MTSHFAGTEQSYGKERWKWWIFRRLRKTGEDDADVMWHGRSFQLQAAATGKARSPTAESRMCETGSDCFTQYIAVFGWCILQIVAEYRSFVVVAVFAVQSVYRVGLVPAVVTNVAACMTNRVTLWTDSAWPDVLTFGLDRAARQVNLSICILDILALMTITITDWFRILILVLILSVGWQKGPLVCRNTKMWSSE